MISLIKWYPSSKPTTEDDLRVAAAARKLWRSSKWFEAYKRGFVPFEEYEELREAIMAHTARKRVLSGGLRLLSRVRS